MENKKFWNQRYKENPEIGSGPGSRGKSSWLKKKLINTIVENNDIHSIVDIGCGDLNGVDIDKLKEKQIKYTGLDISEVIVEKNKLLYPDLVFKVIDLTKEQYNEPADLIVCIDVLIHQIEEKMFSFMLDNITSMISKYALVSYFQTEMNEVIEVNYPNEAIKKEEEFELINHAAKGIKRGEIEFHGGIREWLKLIDSDLNIEPLVSFNWSAVYSIARNVDQLVLGEEFTRYLIYSKKDKKSKELDELINLQKTIFNQRKVNFKLEQIYKNLEKELEEKTRYVKNTENDLTAKVQEIKKITRTIEQKEQEIISLSHDLSLKDEEIKKLTNIVEIKENEVNSLKGEIKKIEKDTAESRFKIKELSISLENMQKHIENQMESIVLCEGLNSSLEEQLQKTQRIHLELESQRKKEIIELDQENRNLKQQINTIVTSKSWKITKPLRYIKSIFSKHV